MIQAAMQLTLGSMIWLPVAAEPTAAKTDVPLARTVDLAKVTELTIDPPAIKLNDPRARQQILVTGKLNGKLVDLTDVAALRSTNDKVLKITDRHEALPTGNGAAEVLVTAGKLEAKAPVSVTHFGKGRTINFPNEIVPIFTKLNCNGGGCHGKSGGQNGFRLSLLGFEPREDYEYLVKESRGRRIFPASPEDSLLFRKPLGKAPHGGGKLLKTDDPNYQLMLDWVNQGMPYGSDADAVVTRIEVFPNHRIMERGGVQRIRVSATFSDGRIEDVTRHALYQSNLDEVAGVDVAGRVTTNNLAGETAIMARYMGQVAVFRATVPVGLKIDKPTPFVAKNFIDQHTSRKWADLGLVPSQATSDSQFIRRLYVDLCGKLPGVEAVKEFVDSTDSNKREKLVDELLESQDYASFMAMKWGAILQNKRAGNADYAAGTHAFSLWLKNAFYHDMPYDRFAAAVLTATGTPEMSPPVVWFRTVRTNEDNVDNLSQLFLGTRIQCAHCHHHPFEKWSQDDYYGMAAFFSRMGRKPSGTLASGKPNEAIFVSRTGSVSHPKKKTVVNPKGLDGASLDVPPGDDPRKQLAEWMTKSDNPFFARTLVNRLWGHFFTRGIVDPIDDMRVTNPPSNPELLDALAADFVKNGYRIKHTVRLICNSATYQLSAEPNQYNSFDKQSYARYYPKRLPAEVLLDSIDAVTGMPTSFGFPQEMRAVDLPDEGVASYFLDIFGRPQRSSSCECERGVEANLSQSLHLLNSSEIQDKLANAAGRANKLADDKRPDMEKVTELFLRALARPPKPEEMGAAIEHINKNKDKKAAYQNLIWALINTKEFLFST